VKGGLEEGELKSDSFQSRGKSRGGGRGEEEWVLGG